MSITTDSMGKTQPMPLKPAMLWFMRLLVIGGLAITSFLAYTQFALQVAVDQSTVPLCGGLSWLDCNTVLNSAHGKWFGLPVSLGAAAAYLVALACLVRPRASVSRFILCALAIAIGLAAGWFIYLQASVLGRWCAWCLAAHLIGLLLFVLTLLFVGVYLPRRQLLLAAVFGGVVVGTLNAGRAPADAVVVKLGGDVGPRGVWTEPMDDGVTPWKLGERAALNPNAHPRIGLPSATKFVVEVIDFQCRNCVKTWPVIHDALEQLGPDVAVLVVFWPLHSACNPHIEPGPDDAKYALSCKLAHLAAAVWLTDPTAYGRFHQWVFAQGRDITAARAEAFAKRLVGPRALRGNLDEAAGELINRDIQLAAHLNLRGLPGLIAADTQFSAVPDEPALLARLIRRVFDTARP